MKFLTTPISGQHLYLKTAILITGLVSGMDSSLSQLLKEGALFLLFFCLEPALYRSLLKAIRTIVPFLAAYWVFGTLFGQLFPVSVQFSIKVLYLALVTVYVFARPDFTFWAYDSRGLRRIGWINTLFVFGLSTMLFIRRFFAEFRLLSSEGGAQMLVSSVGDIFQKVSSDSNKIGDEVQQVLNAPPPSLPNRFFNHALGILFLALLVIIHGV